VACCGYAGYIERFNRTVRYNWLGHRLFESLNELQLFATQWQWIYNHEQPNMTLGGYTPQQRLAQAVHDLYFLMLLKMGGLPALTSVAEAYQSRHNDRLQGMSDGRHCVAPIFPVHGNNNIHVAHLMSENRLL